MHPTRTFVAVSLQTSKIKTARVAVAIWSFVALALSHAPASGATLLFDSGVAYSQTTGGYTLSDGVLTALGFHNSDAWNIETIVIVADFTPDYVAASAELKVVSPASLTTEQSRNSLPIAIGPVIGTRAGPYESRQVTIDVGSVTVASGDHYLGLGFNGTGTFAGWTGYNEFINPTDLGAIYTENGGATWIGPFSQSHAMFSIYGTQVPEPSTLSLLVFGAVISGCRFRRQMMRRKVLPTQDWPHPTEIDEQR